VNIDEKLIEQIVRNVVNNIVSPSSAGSAGQAQQQPAGGPLFDTIEEAIASAKIAQKQWVEGGKDIRFGVVENIRKAALANAEKWAKAAVAETGMGRVEDKIIKNIVAAERSLGPEDLEIKSFSRCCNDNGS